MAFKNRLNKSVPENIKILWLQFVEELPSLHDISISRFVIVDTSVSGSYL
jgi:hypothetical protein